MRLFKANRPSKSHEDEAAAVRLLAIANRSKARISPDLATEAPHLPELPEAPETVQ